MIWKSTTKAAIGIADFILNGDLNYVLFIFYYKNHYRRDYLENVMPLKSESSKRNVPPPSLPITITTTTMALPEKAVFMKVSYYLLHYTFFL